MTIENIPYRQRGRKICVIENCEAFRVGNGLCRKHYMRKWKHGDANTVKARVLVGNTPIEKFWSRVTLTADESRCWEWQEPSHAGGYGHLTWKGKTQLAHRVSFEIANGYMPELHVLHSCDNPKCVNPKHLREGTDQENANDRVERGRTLLGEKNGMAKLTDQIVRQIKLRLSQGELGVNLAKAFNTSRCTISQINTGKRWQNLVIR